MDMAMSCAKRSTCRRLKVGTVITSTDFRKVLSLGYNGNATGLSNTCDSNVPGSCGCMHSEENSIINCDSPRDTPKYVFVTHNPCLMCAKRLINLGNVQRVYYAEMYRDATSIDLLRSRGIEVIFLTEKEKPCEEPSLEKRSSEEPSSKEQFKEQSSQPVDKAYAKLTLKRA